MDPTTLRRKAARFLEIAVSSTNAREGEKLNEVGRQLELWADDLEEIDAANEKKANETRRKGTDKGARGPDADTHS
jgi:hypothetical protein